MSDHTLKQAIVNSENRTKKLSILSKNLQIKIFLRFIAQDLEFKYNLSISYDEDCSNYVMNLPGQIFRFAHIFFFTRFSYLCKTGTNLIEHSSTEFLDKIIVSHIT